MANEIRTVSAADPSTLPDHLRTYCEDDRLSLRRAGQCYRAIDKALIKQEVSTLSLEEVETLLDICAAGLDIETYEPAGPAEKRLRNALLYDNRVFAESRATLRGILSRM